MPHDETEARDLPGSVDSAVSEADSEILAELKTAATHAEAALRESEARYRLLFERNPLPMWVFCPKTLEFLAVNESALEHYGYTREEFARMTVTDVRPPEDVPEVLADLAASPLGQRRRRRRHRRKDGSTIHVDAVSNEFAFGDRMGRLVLISDVTEQLRAESVRKEAHAIVEAAISASPLAIYVADMDLRIRTWNPAAERLFGWKAEEIVGQVAAHVPEDRAAELESLRRSVEHDDGQIVAFPTKRRHRDGSLLDVLVSAAAYRLESGQIGGVVVAFTDMTESRRLEEQLRQALKMEAVGRLAGGIAHDFNNLLTVIKCHTELMLCETTDSDPLRVDMEAVQGAANRAAGLTRQLLAFSRKQLLQPRVLGLNSVVHDIEPLLRRLIGEDIIVETSLDGSLGMILGDPGQMEQVLINLAVNARDAMPNGGTLHIETANVELDEQLAARHDGARAGPHVRLTIGDTGTGMDSDTRSRLFEPFFTTKGPGKGTGLGLATVYGVVRQSGGAITVASAPGEGSEFTIYLPRISGDGAGLRSGRTPVSSETVAPRGGAETVLLAEDEDAVRGLAARLLEEHGYKVLVARNGMDAVEKAESYAGEIHLLLTDVVMPELNGRLLAERLATTHPDTAVLFMSGYTDDEIVRRGLDDGQSMFLQKPFTAAQLLRAVREALDGSVAGVAG